jgi:hypothetical protein
MEELKEAISNIKASLTIQKRKGNVNAEFLLKRMPLDLDQRVNESFIN